MLACLAVEYFWLSKLLSAKTAFEEKDFRERLRLSRSSGWSGSLWLSTSITFTFFSKSDRRSSSSDRRERLVGGSLERGASSEGR